MQPAQRRLVLLRHAKSAWPFGVPDLRRPLAERGRRDAGAVGRWLRDHDLRPGAVVCSPAERTRQTWALVAAELDDPPPARYDERVYDATAEALLALVRDLPDDIATALVIGHNPDMQELVLLSTGSQVEMKTSAVAVVCWSGGWTDVDPAAADLRHHVTPRG